MEMEHSLHNEWVSLRRSINKNKIKKKKKKLTNQNGAELDDAGGDGGFANGGDIGVRAEGGFVFKDDAVELEDIKGGWWWSGRRQTKSRCRRGWSERF